VTLCCLCIVYGDFQTKEDDIDQGWRKGDYERRVLLMLTHCVDGSYNIYALIL